MANNAYGMAAFSSRGPTKEGRFKPDVVAPGTSILSTRSRAARPPSPDLRDLLRSGYFFDSGTSMATPLVAGCAAVLRETLVKNGTPKPSAALIKALLINGADELFGQYIPSEAGPSPNNNSGWGLGRPGRLGDHPRPEPERRLRRGGPLKQGGSDTIVVNDPQGTRAERGQRQAGRRTDRSRRHVQDHPRVDGPAGAALQNDLDLIVRAANGQERHGNMGTSSGLRPCQQRRAGRSGRTCPPGDAKITIRAFRITSFPQPYAYAWRLK